MSMTFTKLFSSITESTIWVEDHQTRIVWITMLAMADAHGRVWGSIPGLANRARVTVDECEAALEKFKAPDRYSRTADNEGRRIECMDGGWRLLNHAKYRAIRDEEAIKESKRKHINTRRAIERVEGVENVELCRTPSNAVELCRPQSNAVDRSRANAEAEAYTEAEASNLFPTSAAAEDGGPGSEGLDWGPTDAAPTVSTFPAPQMPAAPKKQPATPPLADPRHHEITSAWGPAFLEAFGVDYQFSGRDAKTLKRWLATSRATADEILATARAAWDRTKVDRYARNCKEAATIHGLCTHYNEIRVEVQSPPLGAAPVRQGAAPASQGHTRAPTVWELREREKAIFDALRDLSDGRKGQRYVGMRPGHTSAYEWTPDGIAERERLNEELKTVRAALAAAPA